jgi:hypothetical protein
MRIDHDLIRQMLQTIEAASDAEIMLMPELSLDPEEQMYHLQLLIDGRYVTAQQLKPYTRPCALGLTLEGHELLNKLRRKRRSPVKPLLQRFFTTSAARFLFG